MDSNVAMQLLPRGVHRAAYLIDGRPVLHAIDSRGNCLRRVRLGEDVDEGLAREWLDGLLEHYDPTPVLRLVKGEPRPIGVLPTGVYLAMRLPRQALRRTRP